MTGKDFYKSTFDEIQVSGQMLTKLMMLSNNTIVNTRNTGFLYRVVTAIITFIGVMTASGVLFSVPLL